jgi:cyclopropane fatty-acyl-phospholipid synthase-like methyltransferase
MARQVPERIRLAIDTLDLRPDARVLEVGCGTGVAAALLAARVPEGHVTALDRSATAVGHASRRLARWVDAGIADVVERDLRRFHGDGRPYDVILAINVNDMWTDGEHVARLDALLADDGVAHLWYEAPPGGDPLAAGEGAGAALARAGMVAEVTLVEGLARVVARREGHA